MNGAKIAFTHSHGHRCNGEIGIFKTIERDSMCPTALCCTHLGLCKHFDYLRRVGIREGLCDGVKGIHSWL